MQDAMDEAIGETARDIERECAALRDMLLAKNRAYGDSALRPLRVLSRASAIEQILVRIDDKLSRLARGQAAGEDAEIDLLGYLLLLRVARSRAAREAEAARKAETDAVPGAARVPPTRGTRWP